MLIAAAAVVILIALLEVQDDRRVACRFLPDHPLPEACLSRRLFAIDCPGCGLTRSLVYLAQGRLADSLRMHRLGWLVAAAVLVQVPYRTNAARRRAPGPGNSRIPAILGWGLGLALIGDWLAGML